MDENNQEKNEEIKKDPEVIKVEPIPNEESKGLKSTFPKKTSHFNKGLTKNILIVALVIVLGGASGFGGAYLYGKTNKNSSSQTVIYETAENVSANTGTQSETAVEEVVSKVANSVVEIATESVTTSSYLGKYVTSGAGSGVIVTANGYIVTNYHVIEDAKKITVTTTDGTQYEATVVGSDSDTDLAILKIEATGLTSAVLGNSSNLLTGQSVIVIGNPLGSLGGSVTTGIISALSREITISGNTMTLLQTNAAVNPGNSGGGLFDLSGNLIGIVNAKSSGEDVEGIGFAIPIDTAKTVIEDLINQGYVTGRFKLGVSLTDVTTQQQAYQYNVSELGVYVSSVDTDSNASKGGMKSGDRIVSIDGKEVSSSSEVSTIIKSHTAGDKITIIVSRNSSQRTLTITLEETNS